MPPIPAIIPNPINNGMNWMSLFGQMCAIRGKAKVWLLGGGGAGMSISRVKKPRGRYMSSD